MRRIHSDTIKAIEATGLRKEIYDAAKSLGIKDLPDSPEELSDPQLIELYKITFAVQLAEDTYEDIGTIDTSEDIRTNHSERNRKMFEEARDAYGNTIAEIRAGIAMGMGIFGQLENSLKTN